MDKQRLRFLKNVLIVYIFIGLFSATVQYHYLEKSYQTIEKAILFELSAKGIPDKPFFAAYVKKTVAVQTEYLNFVFYIAIWQILLVLAVFFVSYFCLSLHRVLRGVK